MGLLDKFKTKLMSYAETRGRRLRNTIYRKRLKNKDFTLISSNCNGGVMLHDLGLKFNTPFISVGFRAKDYIKLLKNLKHYIYECELCFIKPEIDGDYVITGEETFPVAKLEDLTLYFPHNHSPEEAAENWNKRKARINWDNLFIVFTDRDSCSYEDIADFDRLPYENKVIFTNKDYPEFKSAFHIHGFENEKSVGVCTQFKGHFGKRYLDEFDYVRWLNRATSFKRRRK